MREFVTKLMQQPLAKADTLSTAFGATSARVAEALADLNRPRLRIGVWPIVSQGDAEVAMGVATVLGFLLDRWREMRTYRLFARLEDTPENYQWSINLSQFTVDDWQLEGLDENVAIGGVLEEKNGGWKLKLEVENDLVDDTDTQVIEWEGHTLAELLIVLPGRVSDFASFVGAGQPRAIIPLYNSVANNDAELKLLLTRLFQWELKLLLHLWGSLWDDTEIVTEIDNLLQAGRMCQGEFAAWSVSNAIARAMLPMFEPINEVLVPVVDEVVSSFSGSVLPTTILAPALFQAGQGRTAFELLEQGIETYTDNASLWLTLAELYYQGGYFREAVDTFQRAIEEDATNTSLYTRYGEMLLALDSQGWRVEEFILANPELRDVNPITLETIEAFQAALELDPTNLSAIFLQVIQLVDIENDPRLWPTFQKLVQLDDTGERVRNAIESMYHLDDITPAIHALDAATEQETERYDLYLNLAAAYLVAEKEEAAKVALSKARTLSDNLSVQAEIDRLMLAAGDPNFESRLGEITDLIGNDSTLSSRDIDFLEVILERAPRFSEVYVLLAKAYQTWNEADAVLETLLDGQRILPDDPDILEMLARTLWTSGEKELAFDYINRGLAQYPQHVPLLTLTGCYLFENGQEEAARVFLARAEVISPRHPALNEARVYIAKMRG